jgi:hypothetical protein
MASVLQIALSSILSQPRPAVLTLTYSTQATMWPAAASRLTAGRGNGRAAGSPPADPCAAAPPSPAAHAREKGTREEDKSGTRRSEGGADYSTMPRPCVSRQSFLALEICSFHFKIITLQDHQARYGSPPRGPRCRARAGRRALAASGRRPAAGRPCRSCPAGAPPRTRTTRSPAGRPGERQRTGGLQDLSQSPPYITGPPPEASS